MRLATVSIEGDQRIAAVINDMYVDLNKAYELLLENKGQARAKQIAEAYIPPNMIGFLQGGEDSSNLANEAIEFVQKNDFSDDVNRKLYYKGRHVKLEAPIQKPEKIVCVGLNYKTHIQEMGRELPKIPVVFAKYNNTIIAPGDPILVPKVSECLDHEAELVVVIGKKGKYISEEDAMDYVAGYTVGNEATIRDFQKRTKEWLQGKTFDTTLPLGPHLVTKESLPHPDNCDMRLTLNGEERQHANTGDLVFTIPYLVHFLSEIMTLEVGDIICTGTPGGVGQTRNPQSWMKHGDVVRVEIEGIGALENPIVNE
jgi:acylpyruvate hydrolase